MGFDQLYGVLEHNAAAVEAEQIETDQPTVCPHDGVRLDYVDGPDGLTANCPMGNYSWP